MPGIVSPALAVFLPGPPKYRVFFEAIASTGVRISEAVAWRVKDYHLSGSDPHVSVRRRFVRGHGFGPPKSRHGTRDIPISDALADKLREHIVSLDDTRPDALAFPNREGNPRDQHKLRMLVLNRSEEEVGSDVSGFHVLRYVSGFHVLRHTYASVMLADQGATRPAAIARVMGRTLPMLLKTYSHALETEGVKPMDHAAALPRDKPQVNRPDQTGEDAGTSLPGLEPSPLP